MAMRPFAKLHGVMIPKVRGKNSVDIDGIPKNYFSFPDPVTEKDRYHSFLICVSLVQILKLVIHIFVLFSFPVTT